MAIINFFADPGSYTPGYYATVLETATAIATPYLVQQQNQAIPGATVSDNQVSFNGNTFTVSTNYINPGNGYYIPTPAAFSNVWPTDRFPNAAYDEAAGAFNATIDCVGFGTRVLIATGGNDPAQNAFCLFQSQVDPDAAHFSAAGWVPSAFEYAVALPVLRPGRWSYVCGSVYVPGIQQQEQVTYNGAAKSGLSGAQAGDIVCLAYEDGESNGHFMVLTEAPQKVALTQFSNLPGYVETAYCISVYDSTASGGSLHFNDSRLNDNDTNSGVGYGQLYMFTNNNDEPVGFVFGPWNGGMKAAHFLYNVSRTGRETTLLTNPDVAQTSKLEVVAISLGRFQ